MPPAEDVETPDAPTVPTTAIKFVVRDPQSGISSYAWRLWWGRTSFYLLPLYAPMATRKFSLHGPDPRHARPGFSYGPDKDVDPSVVAEVATGLFEKGRVWFPGRQVRAGVSHVARIRTTWDMFNRRWPSAPFPAGDLKPGATGLIVPPPASLRAMDLDLYVSERRPYWPREERARRDNACIGPLENEAGQFVTAVATSRSVITSPTDPAAIAPPPAGDHDRVRGLGVTVDPAGFVWVLEQWMSRASLTANHDADGGSSHERESP